MKKVLITGINGFVGTHLNNHLLNLGYEVYGTVKPTGEDSHDKSFRSVDILDFEGLKKVIQDIEPDYIYHLAALTSPAESFKNPAATISNNIIGQINILEAVKQLEFITTKTLVVSSAEVYGYVDEKSLPVKEDSPLRPASPYAVSKVAQDYAGLSYFISSKVQSIRVRPFNHIGPCQVPQFVVPAFAKQIAEIEKGKQEAVMRVGNLDAGKDFTDVRDVVRAYEMLMEKGEIGEVYNIGSGSSHKIKEILDTLLSFSDKNIIVEKDPALFRPVDTPALYCDYSKLHNVTGWRPEIALETSLRDTLDYWRGVV